MTGYLGEIIFPIIIILFSSLLGYLGTAVMRKVSLDFGMIDVPNKRSSHFEPIPRGGGLGFVIPFFILIIPFGLLLNINNNELWALLVCSFLISVLGLFDDLYTLSRAERMISWVIITIIFLSFGFRLQLISLPIIGEINLTWLSPLFTFLWLIGVTNFFNFMDGIDGLAGLEALVVSGFLGAFSFIAGNMLIFSSSIILFGSVLGFLPHNFPKAKIFMGDGGSNFLGFIFAALTVIGSQSDQTTIPFLVPVILMMMFLMDAGTTLIKRLPKGKDWLEPHRDHLYQRLIKLGYSHTQVTLAYTFWNIILGGLAILYLKTDSVYSAFIFFLSFLPFILTMFFASGKEKSLKENKF